MEWQLVQNSVVETAASPPNTTATITTPKSVPSGGHCLSSSPCQSSKPFSPTLALAWNSSWYLNFGSPVKTPSSL